MPGYAFCFIFRRLLFYFANASLTSRNRKNSIKQWLSQVYILYIEAASHLGARIYWSPPITGPILYWFGLELVLEDQWVVWIWYLLLLPYPWSLFGFPAIFWLPISSRCKSSESVIALTRCFVLRFFLFWRRRISGCSLSLPGRPWFDLLLSPSYNSSFHPLPLIVAIRNLRNTDIPPFPLPSPTNFV